MKSVVKGSEEIALKVKGKTFFENREKVLGAPTAGLVSL
jgi:hypothetical protein